MSSANNWYEDAECISEVILHKYVFYSTWQEISKVVEKRGYKVKPKSIKEFINNLGLSKKVTKFYDSFETSDGVYKYFNQLMARKPIKYKPPKKRKSHIMKHIFASDPHLPYVDMAVLGELLSQKADVLHLNGDIFDFKSICRFINYNPIPFKTEFNQSMQIIKTICEIFPEVKATDGNHWARLYKYLFNNLPDKSVLDTPIVKFSPQEILKRECPNLFVASNVIKSGYEEDFELCFYNIEGDVLYGHFEKAYKQTFKAVHEAYARLREWADIFGIDLKKIKHFIQAHTHKLGQVGFEGNRVKFYENGCLCGVQEYAVRANLNWPPNQKGWIEMLMEDGEVITDKIKIIYR